MRQGIDMMDDISSTTTFNTERMLSLVSGRELVPTPIITAMSCTRSILFPFVVRTVADSNETIKGMMVARS